MANVGLNDSCPESNGATWNLKMNGRPLKAKEPDPIPIEKVVSWDFSAIRSRFDERFYSLRIDCFALFEPDLWRPSQYICRDVDSHLYYREPMYESPPRHFFSAIEDHLQPLADSPVLRSLTHSHLVYAWFEDADSITQNSGPIHQSFSRATNSRLFAGFAAREKIASSLVFGLQSPGVSREDSSAVDAYLFLNFRSRPRLSYILQNMHEFAELASDIFAASSSATFSHEYEPIAGQNVSAARRRKDEWFLPLYRHMRRLSTLSQEVERHLLEQEGKIETFCQRIIELCFRLIGGSQDRVDFASMHLLDSTLLDSNGRNLPLTLVRTAVSPRDLAFRDDPMPCNGVFESITVLTAISRHAYVLNYIDPPHQSSVPVTPKQYRLLRCIESTLPYKLRLLAPQPLASDSRNDVGRRTGRQPTWSPGRLIASAAPTGDDAFTVIEELRGQVSGASLAGIGFLFDKLRERYESSYSHIFKALTSQWDRNKPSSELCIPISAAGQAVGAINIESDSTYQFHPMLAAQLSFAASVVGLALLREENLKLQTLVTTTAQEILRRGTPVDMGGFAKELQAVLLCDGLRIYQRVGMEDDEVTPYKMLAHYGAPALVEKGMEARPRLDRRGWTAYVGRDECEENFVGVLLEIDETEEVSQAHSIIRRADEWSVGSRIAPSYFEGAQYPTPAGQYGSPSPLRLLLGVRLEQPDNRFHPRSLIGVLWCRFRFPGRVYPHEHPVLRHQLQAYLRRLKVAADHAALVPEAMRSFVGRWPYLYGVFAHEGIERFINAVYAGVIRKDRRQVDLALGYISKKLRLTEKLLETEDPTILHTHYSMLASEVNLRDAIEEIHQTFRAVRNLDRIQWSNKVCEGTLVRAESRVLSVFLMNALENCFIAPNSEAVEVFASRADKAKAAGSWDLCIRSPGTNLSDDELRRINNRDWAVEQIHRPGARKGVGLMHLLGGFLSLQPLKICRAKEPGGGIEYHLLLPAHEDGENAGQG